MTLVEEIYRVLEDHGRHWMVGPGNNGMVAENSEKILPPKTSWLLLIYY